MKHTAIVDCRLFVSSAAFVIWVARVVGNLC